MSRKFPETSTKTVAPLSKLSIYISFILRHRPESAGLELDSEGWVDCAELITACRIKGHSVDAGILTALVVADTKGRYSLSPDGQRIRANQGHSRPVDLKLRAQTPPEVLYHGTGEISVAVIMREGLRPMRRQHVHLSLDIATANTVGSRHGRVKVLKIAAATASRTGVKFYLSANGIWLADAVPAKYLSVLP